MSEKHIKWIWLKNALNDRSVKTYKLYSELGDIDKIYSAGHKEFKKFSFLDDNDIIALENKNLDEAKTIYRLCDANEIGMSAIDDDDYPPMLKEIDNPPCVLFYYGNYEKAFSKPIIAIVGTRNCTTYGEVSTRYISGMLAACGFSIACGIARGIDTVAMESAVKADGSAIMVLPYGLIAATYSVKYKFKDIRYNGVVISEHLPKTKTTKYAYHERNRILSGLSLGTIVTQAPESSGALITANYAADQGRDVFALVANIDMVQSKGSNRLIKDGAIPIFGYEDVLECYLPLYGDKLIRRAEEEQIQALKRTADDEYLKAQDFKRVVINQLTDEERTVFELIGIQEVSVDYLIDRTNFPVPKVLSIISSLETNGVITGLPGNKYKISI